MYKQFNEFFLISFQSQDINRSLAGSKNVTSSSKSGPAFSHNISSLRQRIHRLEQILREKEKEITNLKSDISVSKVLEMEIQTEAYYREICRYAVIQFIYFHYGC